MTVPPWAYPLRVAAEKYSAYMLRGRIRRSPTVHEISSHAHVSPSPYRHCLTCRRLPVAVRSLLNHIVDFFSGKRAVEDEHKHVIHHETFSLTQ